MVEIIKKFKSVHNPDISYEMPLQLILSRPLNDIDLFIGYLNDHHPELTDSFCFMLCSKLERITKDVIVETDIFESKPDNLENYPSLEEVYKRAVLQVLGYERYASDVIDGKAMFAYKDYLNSYLIPAAYMAETTVELLSREEGLEFFRNYVDYKTDHEKAIEAHDSLEALFDHLKSSSTESPQEWSFYFGKDGAVYAKVASCLWSEVLKEFDSEIAYAVACHFDFNAAKHYNENFVLTRTKTIMQGNEYCDFCWRDTRLGNGSHPDDSFWEKLE
ncbi:MAG: L-2-amino-thiazoline-4-carboxylic acid hydrolase [Promethearchaeota archaeon]